MSRLKQNQSILGSLAEAQTRSGHPVPLRRLAYLLLACLLPALLLGSLWLWQSPALAQVEDDPTIPSFAETRAFGKYALSTEVAVGDMDGDGHLDIVMGNEGTQNVVYLNDGDGHFDSPENARYFGTGSDRTTSVAVGDMNGDGALDIVVGNYPNGSILPQDVVYLNDGAGTFSISRTFGTGIDSTYSVALGDMDGDGDLDIVQGNDGSQNWVYLNDDDEPGTFPISRSLGNVSDPTTSVAVGDMDGDGDLDIVQGNNGSQNWVYLNDDDEPGTFPISHTLGTGNDKTYSVAVGDVNGDGHLDIVQGNNVQTNTVYLNDELGKGNFNRPDSAHDFGTGEDQTWSVAVGDMDGDGDLDIVVGNSYIGLPGGDQRSKVYLNDGAGIFGQDHTSVCGGYTMGTLSVAVADVDGDSHLDIIAANHSAGNYHYQRNLVCLNDGAGTLGHGSYFEDEFISDTYKVAVGDVDGDGHLDIVAGDRTWPHDKNTHTNTIYLNDGAGNFDWSGSARNFGIGSDDTTTVALGDLNGDGNLDIVIGNESQQDRVYLNDGAGTFSISRTFGTGSYYNTHAVALGDMNGDGDLDIVQGNISQPNVVYLNDGNGNFDWPGSARNFSDGTYRTLGLAVGDMDGDGDLDIVVGNDPEGQPEPAQNWVYLNDGEGNFPVNRPFGTGNDKTYSVAVGDLDGDGDIDIVAGNLWDQDAVYLNNGEAEFLDSSPFGDTGGWTHAVAVGDMNGDEYLDIIIGNIANRCLYGHNWVFMNDGNGNFSTSRPFGDESNTDDTCSVTRSIALGDMDDDGDLDIATADDIGNRVYLNDLRSVRGLPNHAPTINLTRPVTTGNANFFSTPVLLVSPIITLTYTLADPEGNPAGWVAAFYSQDSGGNWETAVATTDTITTNLASSPSGINHTFTWDTFASKFFGQSDNVVVRILAYPQPIHTGITGTYGYTKTFPGPYQWPYASATTFPFRVRGTQVRVYTDTIHPNNGLDGAIVYRLPDGQDNGAEPMATASGQPFHTDTYGFLQGRGELGQDDKLVALYPISRTASYTIYHTSGAPTESGLTMQPVTQPGVQELVVSANNTLILFDLDVSLEWDARNDPTFMAQLRQDIRHASQILYDLSNGQVALGQVHIYHARKQWAEAHILIQANNSQRPGATLGGIVLTPTHDIISPTYTITNAFLPGQVRLGPTWSRFGDPGGIVGEDWPRALAHELGHYLLYMPDNYLGLTADGFLTLVDCPGSAMTDPYRDAYSEFLTPDEWKDADACQDTVAARYLGRADWETIHQFYPMLTYTRTNTGPATLPLAVTQVEFVEPVTPTQALMDPFFSLTNADGQPLPLSAGQAQGYLRQTQSTTSTIDDNLIYLGSPVGDLLQARGAAPGDELCVYDFNHDPMRLGCREVGQTAGSLALHELPDWAPQIQVAPVNSRTFQVTVTNVISENNLKLQLFPGYGAASAELDMNLTVGADFTQTVTLTDPAFTGFVRIWAPDSAPYKEMLTEFLHVADWSARYSDWGARYSDWGARYAAWGARYAAWGAPVQSTDGQVSLYALDDLFGSDVQVSLQALPLPPALPIWLTPVGRAYRVETGGQDNQAILFRYLGQEVPGGQEHALSIYYLPQDAQAWIRLETELDGDHNYATAAVPGDGTYVLIATLEMPPLTPGWNTFAYPVAGSRPVTETLASIDGVYTSLYQYLPAGDEWILFDRGVSQERPVWTALVNDLALLEFGHTYWLYATEAVTPYLGVAGPGETSSAADSISIASSLLPPATFFGPITPTLGLQVGDLVTATIDGVLCGTGVVTDSVADTPLAYKIQVRADTGDDCGITGQQIIFSVAGRIMPNDHLWGNSRACYHPLGAASTDPTSCFFPFRTYFPLALHSFTSGPDLVVTQFGNTVHDVEIVIENQE